MQVVIEKNIDKNHLITNQICLVALKDSGIEILDSNNLIFSENYNLSTHTGENRAKIFNSLLKGKIEIDSKKSVIRWHLRLDGILFKAILISLIIFVAFFMFYETDLISSIVFGGVIGGVIFLISKVSLNNKVNTITKKISAHNASLLA